MSIQNTRQKIITELLLQKNLQNGILPSSKEFIWQLNQAMNEAGKNSTAFKFKPFKKDSIAKAETFNQYHSKIKDEFRILYDNIQDLYYNTNKEYQYFLTEKDKLEKQIDVLENELKFFIQNNQRAQTLPYAYETFDDNSKVDMSKTKNIVIDTKNNSAKLSEEKNTTRRIYPSKNVTFKISNVVQEKKENNITGELWNPTYSETDKIWQHHVRVKQEQVMTGVLQFEFNEQWYINQVDMSFITIKPFQLYCTYSLDGVEWYDMPNYAGSVETLKDISFNFPSIPMKYFRLEITKTQADEVMTVEDGFNFHYLFGMHEIRFYHKQFPVRGELYSKVLEFKNEPKNYSINTIRLHTDEYLPTGTDIKYEIALADEQEPNWQVIDPINRKNPANPQTISLSRMISSGEDLYFNPGYSSTHAEAEDLLSNGIPVYRLSQLRDKQEHQNILPRKLREDSLKLYVGNNSWEILSFPSENVNDIPKVEDFKGVFSGTKIWYQNLTEDHNGYLFKNHKESSQKKYMARIAIYLEESRTITTRPVSSNPFALYLNSELYLEGKPGQERDIHLALKAGWNEIVILINGLDATSVNGMSFLLGFNPNRITDTIYSRSKPLVEVSLFDLRYNTKRNDRTVFAKRETVDGWEILTNFWYPGLNFRLHYDYKADELPEHDNLILRATFTREDGIGITTPVLRNYRIECT